MEIAPADRLKEGIGMYQDALINSFVNISVYFSSLIFCQNFLFTSRSLSLFRNVVSKFQFHVNSSN